MLGKIEGGRSGRQRVRWLDGITDSMDMEVHWLRRRPSNAGGTGLIPGPWIPRAAQQGQKIKTRRSQWASSLVRSNGGTQLLRLSMSSLLLKWKAKAYPWETLQVWRAGFYTQRHLLRRTDKDSGWQAEFSSCG